MHSGLIWKNSLKLREKALRFIDLQVPSILTWFLQYLEVKFKQQEITLSMENFAALR